MNSNKKIQLLDYSKISADLLKRKQQNPNRPKIIYPKTSKLVIKI